MEKQTTKRINTDAYRTQSVICPMNMPPIEGVSVIGADIGYSSVKVVTDNKYAIIPSHIRRVNEEDLAMRSPRDTDILYRGRDGVTWAVGELAYEIGSSDSEVDSEVAMFGRSWCSTSRYRILVDTGIGISLCGNENGGPDKNNEIRVVTGLPPKYMTKSEKDEVANAFSNDGEQHEYYLKIGKGQWSAYRYYINKRNVQVISQPHGALFCASITPDVKMSDIARRILTGTVGIIDGGFGTLDFCGIKDAVTFQKETFPQRGMREIYLRTCKGISERYGKDIQVTELQNILSSGQISVVDRKTLTRRTYHIDDILEESVNSVFDDAIRDILDATKFLESYNLLIGTGGEFDAWESILKDKLSAMEIPIISANRNLSGIPNTVSNAFGYYLYLKKQLINKSVG